MLSIALYRIFFTFHHSSYTINLRYRKKKSGFLAKSIPLTHSWTNTKTFSDRHYFLQRPGMQTREDRRRSDVLVRCYSPGSIRKRKGLANISDARQSFKVHPGAAKFRAMYHLAYIPSVSTSASVSQVCLFRYSHILCSCRIHSMILL